MTPKTLDAPYTEVDAVLRGLRDRGYTVKELEGLQPGARGFEISNVHYTGLATLYRGVWSSDRQWLNNLLEELVS